MRKTALFLLFICMTLPVTAFGYSVDVEDRVSSPEDPAVFNVSVQNDQGINDTFRISSVQAPPAVEQWFSYDYRREIPAGKKGYFPIRIYHGENILQQNYAFTVNLRSFKGEGRKTFEEYFTVQNPKDLEISSFSTSGASFRPGEGFEVEVEVKSTASRKISNLTVNASFMGRSEITRDEGLEPGNSVKVSFNLKVPENASPGGKRLEVSVYRSGRKDGEVARNITVEKVTKIDRNTAKKDRILRNTVRVEVLNSGNAADRVEVSRSIPVYLKPLTTAEPEPDRISRENGRTFYRWEKELKPGEEASFTVRTDFTPLLVIGLVLAVGVLGIRKLQTDIRFRKKAEETGEGIQVLIELENSSGVVRKDLKVKDFVPDIAEVEREFEMAKPLLTKTKNGTKLEWKIDRLEPGEERVMKYTLRPRVEVEGGAVLPSAEVFAEDIKVKETSEVEVEFAPE